MWRRTLWTISVWWVAGVILFVPVLVIANGAEHSAHRTHFEFPVADTITALIAVVIGLFQFLLGHWMRRLDKDQEGQNERLNAIELDLSAYKANVAVGITEVRAINEKLGGHIEREENTTWKKIDENDRRNTEAHTQILVVLESVKSTFRQMQDSLTTIARRQQAHEKEAEVRDNRLTAVETKLKLGR